MVQLFFAIIQIFSAGQHGAPLRHRGPDPGQQAAVPVPVPLPAGQHHRHRHPHEGGAERQQVGQYSPLIGRHGVNVNTEP